MLEYLFGSFVDWDTLAYMNAVAPAVALVLACFIPESPSWLISSQKNEALCRASLRRVRDSRCDVDTEVNDLIMFSKTNGSSSFKEKLRQICKPSTYKPFLIVSLYFLLSQFSGLNVVTFYAVEVIRVSTVKLMIQSFLKYSVFIKVTCCCVRRTRDPLLTSTWPPSCWELFG